MAFGIATPLTMILVAIQSLSSFLLLLSTTLSNPIRSREDIPQGCLNRHVKKKQFEMMTSDLMMMIMMCLHCLFPYFIRITSVL